METIKGKALLIVDTKFEETEHFPNENELIILTNENDKEDYIENHSHPENLDIRGNEYIEVLSLIGLNNHPKIIRKIIEKKGFDYNEIIEFLKEKRLIIFIGKNWMDNFTEACYKILRRGTDLIGVKEI